MQIVAYLAYLVHLALADTNCFINPNYNGTVTLLPYRLNPVWNIGETQVIRWLTNLTSYNVTLWQQGIKDPGAALAAIVFANPAIDPNVRSFPWVVQTYSLDLSVSNVFFFWLVASDTQNYTSSFFNITNVTATLSPVTVFISATISSTPTISVLSPLTPTISTTPTPQVSDVPSKVKLALGLGLGLTIPAMLILGAWIGWMLRRMKRARSYPPKHILRSDLTTQASTNESITNLNRSNGSLSMYTTSIFELE